MMIVLIVVGIKKTEEDKSHRTMLRNRGDDYGSDLSWVLYNTEAVLIYEKSDEKNSVKWKK